MPAPLKGGKFFLSAAQHYRLVEVEPHDWRTKTTWYAYAWELDEREVLAYHWHPDGVSPFRTPHLHIRHSVVIAEGLDLASAHLPTGRVALEQVVSLAIKELGIEPLRPDWDEVLSAALAKFDQERHW